MQRLILPLAVLLSITSFGFAQGTRSDYRRSETYSTRHRNKVIRDRVNPNWFGENQDKLWYRIRTAVDSHEYVLVDAAEKRRIPAFDHDVLSQQLAKLSGKDVSAKDLDLSDLRFDEDLNVMRFRYAGADFQYDRENEQLSKSSQRIADTERDGLRPQTSIARSRGNGPRTPIRFDNRLEDPLSIFWVTGDGQLQAYGTVAGGTTESLSTYSGHAWLLQDQRGNPVASFIASMDQEEAIIDSKTPRPRRSGRRRGRRTSSGTSPDMKWRVEFSDDNVVLVDLEKDERRNLTDTGSPQNRFGGRIWWAPDSSAFVVMQTTEGTRREVSIVDSMPDNTVHPKLLTFSYAKPGDDLDQSRPVMFTLQDGWDPRLIDNELFSNPFRLNDLRWNEDSKSFSFLYNQRGHQIHRLIQVNAESAEPTAIIDETSDTFVCYSQKTYLQRLDATNEIIWMSERSGWNHLYLIDMQTGDVKNEITSGEWVVRSVERVDPESRQIWLSVSGIDAGQDPYYLHLVRVNFDGTGFVRLTRGDGTHRWSFSDDNRFLIDTYSRVDMPPVTELRDANSGELICELERGDMRSLLETGWQPPERFVAKGRDGKTDIYGIIVRPTNFDPTKTYPVLEAIYAGPHSAFVPKSFGLQNSLYKMAELGFVIVKIDGMGTSHRSKAFHDVCWKNLGDSGFPDRILWMQEAARTRPEMDLSRVGIWGGSAGGQSAMRALIAHGDFYHAAVADCGCHDNRVDKIWWNEQWMGWPIGQHYAEQSNVTQAHRVKGDLMLIWGELDRNVDPASTMQVIDALVKADVDFEQLIMPGQGHGAAGHPYANRRQADFFVRKLWGREPRGEE